MNNIVTNIYKVVLTSAAITATLASCNSDMDTVYVLPQDTIELMGATNEIILTPDNPQALALTVYWNGDGRLALSDTLLQAPVNAAETIIQLSKDEQFSAPQEITVDKGVRSRQFLSEELNSLLGRMGYEADVKAPMWIRISSVLAANVSPSYSNAIKVMVQSYQISLTLGRVLNSNWDETSMQLASPEENGIYTGFMGVGGWENWWFREANNIVWGNLGEEGKPFYASSADSHWNFWFPAPGGCYYTTLNTVEGWWSALYIENLSVSGDITGEMEYNKAANQWSLSVNLATASTISLSISGKGFLYNRETTDTGNPIEQTVSFSGDSQNLTFGTATGTISLSVPAGETALILDLSNPLQFVLGTGEAAPEPETSQQLYFSGLVTWNGFDDYLTLYDEANLSYGGAHWINSEWGYRVYTVQDWSPAYKATDESTALSGTMILAESDGNIPAPEEGLYVMDFNMKNLTYELTKIETVSYAGLNDDWTVQAMTQSADNPEVFTAEFVKTQETPWGVKVLINGSWELFFGGTGGTLQLGHSDATQGFDGDNELEIGKTYILTVDLGSQTYSYSQK